MKTTTGTIVSGFIMIIAGVMLCILNSHPDILTTIVKIVGGAFALAGVINIIIALVRRHRKSENSMANATSWISGIGGTGLGCAMLFSPLFFTPILVFLFGAILLIGGAFQVIMLAWGYRPYVGNGWMFVMPVLEIIGGVIMICSETVRYNNPAMLLITGIGFIFFGLTSFMTIIGVAGSKKTVGETGGHVAENQHHADEIHDVDATEVHSAIPEKTTSDDSHTL